MSEPATHSPADLPELLSAAGQLPLDIESADRFGQYLALLLRWNAKTNLTSIRDRQEILSRHFVESIICARTVPAGVTSLLDFGSGAGFPGLPIALCRPEIFVTLAESQGKKAAFLLEAARVLQVYVRVHAARAETLAESFDCVTLRAVDSMADATRAALKLVKRGGWLMFLSTNEGIFKVSDLEGEALGTFKTMPLSGSANRVLAIAERL